MAGIKDNLMRFIVLGSLIVGFSFNLWVVSDCNYLDASYGSLELGVFRYSLQLDASDYNTSGECTKYGKKASDGYVRTAQVCAVLAPIFGAVLILLITTQQCCCNVPCSGIIVSLSYIGAQVCTALIWLIYRTKVCEEPQVSCEWGKAASGNFIAQMMYLIAAIFHRCMPSPKEAAANRRADAAEKKAADAEAKEAEAVEKQKAAEAATAAAEAQMKDLESQPKAPAATPAVTGL